MVANLNITDLAIDPITTTEKGGWYTVASFHIVETRKILGIFKKRMTYTGSELSILITSSDISPDDLEDTHPAYFNNRLILDKLNESQIKEYVSSKFNDACAHSKTTLEVFESMEKYFLVDD